MSGVHWATEEDNLLRELVATKKYSYNQMAPRFPGRTGVGLMKRAINYLGLKHNDFVFKKYSVNDHFFSVPNPINCYVAGYYGADGCITDNPTTRVLTMELSQVDQHQLETFKRLFEFTGNVQDSSYPDHENMCALRMYSAYQMTADLEKHFGLTKNKVHRLPPPNITNPHLQLCYFAGLLDGDGCVHIDTQGKVGISYVSASRSIVEWVKGLVDGMNLLALKTGRHFTISKCPHANAYRFAVSGAKAIGLIKRIQRLKSEGVPILDRKWDNQRLNDYIRDFETKHRLIP